MILFCVTINYRCDLEVCKSNDPNGSISTEDLIDCVPGKFAIFGFAGIPINEQILKAAGLC